jgi:hypothetical protein
MSCNGSKGENSRARLLGTQLSGRIANVRRFLRDVKGVGAAHQFHTKNHDARFPFERDDPYTAHIDWPNFHSGANGDFQQVEIVGDTHPVLVDASSPTGATIPAESPA